MSKPHKNKSSLLESIFSSKKHSSRNAEDSVSSASVGTEENSASSSQKSPTSHKSHSSSSPPPAESGIPKLIEPSQKPSRDDSFTSLKSVHSLPPIRYSGQNDSSNNNNNSNTLYPTSSSISRSSSTITAKQSKSGMAQSSSTPQMHRVDSENTLDIKSQLMKRPSLKKRPSSIRSSTYISPDDDDSDANASILGAANEKFSVFMKEAVADTPSFRATIQFTHPQIVRLEKWFDDFLSKAEAVHKNIENVKDSSLTLTSHCEPSTSSMYVMEHEYATMVLTRFSDKQNSFWSSIFNQSAKNVQEIRSVIQKLKDGAFAKYYTAQKYFARTLQILIEVFTEYTNIPPQAEPVALRDAVVRLHKVRWKYLCAATTLVFQIVKLQTECSLVLIETLSDHNYGPEYIFRDKSQPDSCFVGTSFPPIYADRADISFELYRLRVLGKSLRKSVGKFYSDLRHVRQEMLQEIRPAPVSIDVNDYIDYSAAPTTDAEVTFKTGWVNCQKSNSEWVALYAFVRNGRFGLLGCSDAYVQESKRYPSAQCVVTTVESSSRRFLFKVKYKDDEILLQALGRSEYSQWLTAFKVSSEMYADEKIPILAPWNSKYTLKEIGNINTIEFAPGCDIVQQRSKDVHEEFSQDHYFKNSGMLSFSASYRLCSYVPSTTPMPNAGLIDNVVANWFYHPSGTLNAISANYWGCVGWDGFEQPLITNEGEDSTNADSNNSGTSENTYGFPQYPKEYPRKIILLDMDMRAITNHMPQEQRPAPDDLLIFTFRGTSTVLGHEAPVRMFVTRSKLIGYTLWGSFTKVDSFDLSNIAEIDCEFGIEYSELTLSMQETDGSVSEPLTLKLYIDSAVLVKSRLEFLISNARSNSITNYVELFEPMSVTLPDSLPHPDPDAIYSSEHKSEGSQQSAMSLSEYLYRNSIDGASEGQSNNVTKLGKGMHSKMMEYTFPISAKALFMVIFGPKSPVFNSKQSMIVDCTYKAGPWYHKAKRLCRKLQVKTSATTHLDSSLKKTPQSYTFDQYVVYQNRDLYIVVERRPNFETPSGDRFYLEFKYFLYSTGQGSYLQIWSRVVWSKPPIFDSSADAISGVAKLIVRPITNSIRETADQVHGSSEAREKFGAVYATYESDDKSEDHRAEMHYQRLVEPPSLFWFVRNVQSFPVRCTTRFFNFVRGMPLLDFTNISMYKILMTMVLISSFFLNIMLYKRTSTSYWIHYFDQKRSDALVEALGVVPKAGAGTVFKRSIYIKDIDDALARGNLWALNTGVDSANASKCTHKFIQAATLSSWVSDYGEIFEYENQFEETARRIADLRENFAITRNRLMTQLWVLNAQEREELTSEYRRWLINEANVCSRVRLHASMLNSTVKDDIRDYCIGCLQDAKHLL